MRYQICRASMVGHRTLTEARCQYAILTGSLGWRILTDLHQVTSAFVSNWESLQRQIIQWHSHFPFRFSICERRCVNKRMSFELWFYKGQALFLILEHHSEIRLWHSLYINCATGNMKCPLSQSLLPWMILNSLHFVQSAHAFFNFYITM